MDKEELRADLKNILAECRIFRRESSFIRLSEMETNFSSTDLLIEIVKRDSGQALCGGGASGNQKEYVFDLVGIKLFYRNLSHLIYTQSGKTFGPGLSIIDAVMNLGIKETRDNFNDYIQLKLRENHSC